ncbi:MAG: carbon storage regulator [Pirellulales bacterium]
MLVLSRKPEQQIQIGNDIVVTILKVRGSKVSVGIHAPGQVRILRAEVSRDSLDCPTDGGEHPAAAAGFGTAGAVPQAPGRRAACAGPLAGALRRARASLRPSAPAAAGGATGAEIVSDVAGMLNRSAHGTGGAAMLS